jgi:hypothetical protein
LRIDSQFTIICYRSSATSVGILLFPLARGPVLSLEYGLRDRKGGSSLRAAELPEDLWGSRKRKEQPWLED